MHDLLNILTQLKAKADREYQEAFLGRINSNLESGSEGQLAAIRKVAFAAGESHAYDEIICLLKQSAVKQAAKQGES